MKSFVQTSAQKVQQLTELVHELRLLYSRARVAHALDKRNGGARTLSAALDTAQPEVQKVQRVLDRTTEAAAFCSRVVLLPDGVCAEDTSELRIQLGKLHQNLDTLSKIIAQERHRKFGSVQTDSEAMLNETRAAMAQQMRSNESFFRNDLADLNSQQTQNAVQEDIKQYLADLNSGQQQ